ncbi:DUF4194 domain-containing protein [Nocardioides jishulii]|uniref:DUF4194 domain-containing protein n=1 Tax=Nocardioides jishulii TaxID=2575440 RepID=A0A4U2YPS7_9ACTN|nr:DUF4194 domain-containing protein [Nocardioides jishulii]QCX27868.1 DUF4194 domain-containing protein [Nocardioides jishulii]TKI62675.1 DUF4194 domain-containing protein [Nocardioides jishulii]
MSDLEQDLEQDLGGDLADDLGDDLGTGTDDSHDTASVSLFEGDEGTLEFTRRRTLVTLLKARFISARTHPREWEVLVEDERLLRSRLNDLFLDLQVDREREVAWKRQASSETGGRFPTLLHDVPWSREETLVLVHLRDRLRAGYASGESRVFIDREDIVEHVASFRPLHATDESGDEKRARNAVLSIVKSGLLIGAAGDDRYEISEAVEPLLPLELLTELLEALRRANSVEERPARVEDLFGEGAPEHDENRRDENRHDDEEWA